VRDDGEAALLVNARERLLEGQPRGNLLLDAECEHVTVRAGNLHARNRHEVVVRGDVDGAAAGVELVVVGDGDGVQVGRCGVLEDCLDGIAAVVGRHGVCVQFDSEHTLP